jgi:predicted unusual protein kinase regulating ubiquinone biosynthesis (AarF/ABC1/UbiB family)
MAKDEDGHEGRADAPPTSRFGRLARLGALAPRALPFAAAAVKKAFSAGKPQEAESEADRAKMLLAAKKTAEAMLQTLGEMKGLPLKFGQMASYIDGLAPPGYEDRFQEILKKLQAKAPPLSADAAWKVICEDLGDPPDTLYASYEREPFAAASIGQVHRARTKGGDDVAVKVQYPGIDKAIENDLKSLGMLEGMFAPFGRKYHTKETFEEIRSVFLNELDYVREAQMADAFRAMNAGDDDIVVPRVFHGLTGKRVLTIGFVEGTDYETFCATASPEERQRAGAAIWRFMFRALYKYGMLYADPHPGNYRFLPGGRVAFLDYGCVRELPPDLVAGMKRLVVAAMDGDEQGLIDTCVQVYGFDPKDPDGFQLYVEYTKMLLRPFVLREWTHTKEAAREAIAYLVRNGRPLVMKEGDALPRMPKPIHMPVEHTFVNRLQWGLASVMGGIGSSGNYRELVEPFVRGPLVR